MENRSGSKTSGFGYRLLSYFAKFTNIILMTAPFALCWYLCYADEIRNPFFNKGNWVVVGLFAALYTMFCKLYSGLKISTSRISENVYSQTLSALIANGFMYIVISLLSSGFVSVWELIAALTAQFLISVVWTWTAHKIFSRKIKPLRTAVIWDTREGMDELFRSYDLEKRFDVHKSLHISACADCIEDTLRDTEAVFLCGVHSSERNQIVKYCIKEGVQVYVIPRIGDVLMGGAKETHMFHIPMVTLGRYDPSPEFVIFKRFFDIVISALTLVILSPLMLIVALLIKCDGGTVFYKQKRLTKDRKEFCILKFRSMRMNAENDGIARLSSGSADDRITPVGRIIRRLRIDELPQLLNIIKGDMSIVGPRPERPEIAGQYEKEMPEFALRLQAKAGLTGQAQVYGKYNSTPYDKLLMDLQYIAAPSLVNDLKIIFATVKILFMHESTEGVQEGNVTAAPAEEQTEFQSHIQEVLQ